jgi:hypothetical protein
MWQLQLPLRFKGLKKLISGFVFDTLHYLLRVSSVSIVWLRTGRPGDRSSIPGRGERTFPLVSVSRPALGPTQPPVQWVPGVLSPGLKRGRGVTLTTNLHLVLRSRMSRSYTSSPSKTFMVCNVRALAFRITYLSHTQQQVPPLADIWLNTEFYLLSSTKREQVAEKTRCTGL